MPWNLWAKLLLLPVMVKEPEWGAWCTVTPSSSLGLKWTPSRVQRNLWTEKGSEDQGSGTWVRCWNRTEARVPEARAPQHGLGQRRTEGDEGDEGDWGIWAQKLGDLGGERQEG